MSHFIFYLFIYFFSHFKTNLQLLKILRRMLQCFFAEKLHKCFVSKETFPRHGGEQMMISVWTAPLRESVWIVTCMHMSKYINWLHDWMTVHTFMNTWMWTCCHMHSCMQVTAHTQTAVQQRAPMHTEDMIRTHAQLGQFTFHLWFVLCQAPLLPPQLPMWCHHLWPLGSRP